MQQHLGEYEEEGNEPLGLVGDERLDEFVRPRRRLPAILLTIVVMAVLANTLMLRAARRFARQPDAAVS